VETEINRKEQKKNYYYYYFFPEKKEKDPFSCILKEKPFLLFAQCSLVVLTTISFNHDLKTF